MQTYTFNWTFKRFVGQSEWKPNNISIVTCRTLKWNFSRCGLLFHPIVITFSFFNNLCAITKDRPKPGLLEIRHTTIIITIRDYEIQFIIITITWYGFFFLNTTATLSDQLSLSISNADSKCPLSFRLFFNYSRAIFFCLFVCLSAWMRVKTDQQTTDDEILTVNRLVKTTEIHQNLQKFVTIRDTACVCVCVNFSLFWRYFRRSMTHNQWSAQPTAAHWPRNISTRHSRFFPAACSLPLTFFRCNRFKAFPKLWHFQL